MTRDNWQDGGFAARWDETGNLSTNPDRLNQLSLISDLLAAQSPGHILDLGIGSAQVEMAIHHRHPEFFSSNRITGIDASDAMLDLAGQRCTEAGLSAVTLLKGDFARLHAVAVAGPADSVLCVQALHEVPDTIKKEVFSWVHDHIKTGARFYILDRFQYEQVHWLEDWQGVWDWMGSALNQDILEFGTYHSQYQSKTDHVSTVSEYREWLQQSGFETICPYHCFNRAMIIAKKLGSD